MKIDDEHEPPGPYVTCAVWAAGHDGKRAYRTYNRHNWRDERGGEIDWTPTHYAELVGPNEPPEPEPAETELETEVWPVADDDGELYYQCYPGTVAVFPIERLSRDTRWTGRYHYTLPDGRELMSPMARLWWIEFLNTKTRQAYAPHDGRRKGVRLLQVLVPDGVEVVK